MLQCVLIRSRALGVSGKNFPKRSAFNKVHNFFHTYTLWPKHVRELFFFFFLPCTEGLMIIICGILVERPQDPSFLFLLRLQTYFREILLQHRYRLLVLHINYSVLRAYVFCFVLRPPYLKTEGLQNGISNRI